MHLKAFSRPLLGALLLLLSAPAWAGSADEAFRTQYGDAYLDRYWKLHPDAAITAGYYKHASELPAPGAKYRAELGAFLKTSIAGLEKLKPEEMSDAVRSDREMLLNQLQFEQWSLDTQRDWAWDPSEYNEADPFALLLNTQYAPEPERLRTVSKRLAQVPAYFAAAKKAIAHPTREHTQLAIQQNTGALDVFGESLEKQVKASALNAQERATLLKRAAAARAAIQDYVAFLKALDEKLAKGGARSFRLGEPLYDQKFAYAIQTGMKPQQLYERALQEKDRLHERMSALADQLWPKYFPNEQPPADRVDKIGKLIAKLSEQHVAKERFVDEVKALIPKLEDWVRQKNLATLDPDRPLEVRITPPYKRGVSMASIDAPGPYDPSAKTYFNVTPLDDFTPEQAESFLREYNQWQYQVLVIHEAVPGHYVQLVYANKSPSRIKAIFGNGSMIEGWAVYSERMMLESGWNPSPEMDLIYSKWALRVTCNTILDYGVHVLNMSEDDAHRLLTRDAFQSETEARGKWRRVQLSSVQLPSYFAGYSAIYDYRERIKQQLGARFDLKRFHEKFLSYGSAPVVVIESLIKTEDVAAAAQ